MTCYCYIRCITPVQCLTFWSEQLSCLQDKNASQCFSFFWKTTKRKYTTVWYFGSHCNLNFKPRQSHHDIGYRLALRLRGSIIVNHIVMNELKRASKARFALHAVIFLHIGLHDVYDFIFMLIKMHELHKSCKLAPDRPAPW